jgi:putative ABC transport system ATP-binding protein
VLVNDAPLGDRDHAVSPGVVLIPQDNGLAAIPTAAENIAVAMIATGSTPAEARRGTSESLETALPPDRIEVIGQPGC